MPVITSFDSGDTIRFANTFSVSGTATDPTTITFRIKDPNQVVSTYVYLTNAELVRSGTGAYRIDLILSLPGEYWHRWEGTGTAPGAAEDRIKIIRSHVLGS